MPGGRPSNKPAPKFGQRLAALRIEHGLSQTALAAQLGTTRNAILHYERAAKNPSADFVEKVAAFFSVSADVLLALNTRTQRKPGPPSEWEKRFNAIKALPRDKQREIQNVVDALIAKAG